MNLLHYNYNGLTREKIQFNKPLSLLFQNLIPVDIICILIKLQSKDQLRTFTV